MRLRLKRTGETLQRKVLPSSRLPPPSPSNAKAAERCAEEDRVGNNSGFHPSPSSRGEKSPCPPGLSDNVQHAISLIQKKKDEQGDNRTDFYWKLDMVSKRVHQFVDLMGCKSDLMNIKRTGDTRSTLRPSLNADQKSFMDELNTYKDIRSLKRLLTQIEEKKEKYESFKQISRRDLEDYRLKGLRTSLQKNIERSNSMKKESRKRSKVMNLKLRSRKSKANVGIELKKTSSFAPIRKITRSSSLFDNSKLDHFKDKDDQDGSKSPEKLLSPQNLNLSSKNMLPVSEVSEVKSGLHLGSNKMSSLDSASMSKSSVSKKKRRFKRRAAIPSPVFLLRKEVVDLTGANKCKFKELEKYLPNERLKQKLEKIEKTMKYGEEESIGITLHKTKKEPKIRVSSLSNFNREKEGISNGKTKNFKPVRLKRNTQSVQPSFEKMELSPISRKLTTTKNQEIELKAQKSQTEAKTGRKAEILPVLNTQTENFSTINDYFMSMMTARTTIKRSKKAKYSSSMPRLAKYNMQNLKLYPTFKALKRSKISKK